MTLPVCPRCHRTILPIPVPVNSLDLQKVIYTYGQDQALHWVRVGFADSAKSMCILRWSHERSAR